MTARPALKVRRLNRPTPRSKYSCRKKTAGNREEKNHNMKNIKIETERLIIYTASEDEMRQITKEQTDEELKSAYRQMLQGALDHPDLREWYAVWIIKRKDGVKIGSLCFKGLNGDGSVEIGYGVSEEHRGRGYATEAVGAAVSWALHQSGVTRVEAETDPENKASRKVLSKCGFAPTGKTGEEGPRFVKTL